MLRDRLQRAIRAVEVSTLHWSYWIGTFVAFVVIRNVVESALGPDRVFGFAHAGPSSAAMVLDHFVLFYASVFLSIALLLSALSGERIVRVMRVMSPAWALVLIPPVVDFLVTGGEGTHISYVLSLSGTLSRFFDPRVVLERISVGQRVEVAGACALGLLYVRLKGRSWLRAGAAFVLIYLAIAAHGVLPSAFARLARLVSEGAVGLPAAAYDATFRSGGLVLEESRKLALLFLFSSSALAWLAFVRHAPRWTSAFARNLRPLRALHYVGMTAFGVALGFAVAAPSGFSFSGGGDALGVAGLLFATFLAFEASVALNDLTDVTADSVSEPTRPLVTGELGGRHAAMQFAGLGALGLLAALNVKYSSFLFLTTALLVSLLYSARPVRLKRIPLIGTLSLGLMSLLTCLVGFSAVMEARSLRVFPARVGWVLFLAFGLAFTVKDLKDVPGDRADGTLTLPILLGRRGGRIATALLAALGYLTVPLFLPYGALGWLAAALAGLNAAAVLLLPTKRLVRPLLAVYLAFAALTGVVIVRNVESVLGTSARTAASDQAASLIGARELSIGDAAAAVRAYGRVDDPEADQQDLERAGVALVRAGAFRQAVGLLEAAVAREPSDPVTTEHLIVARRGAGDPVQASRLAREAVERGLRPDVFLAHDAELAVEAGRPGDAVELLTASLRTGADEVRTRVRLGSALLLAGNPESALAELSAAVELDPTSATSWNNLAVVRLELGRYEEALAALDRATDLDPLLPDAYFNRGRVFEALGRSSPARRQFLLALEIDPAFAPARRALSDR